MRALFPVSVLAWVAACPGDAPDTTDTAATTETATTTADGTTTETTSTATATVPTTGEETATSGTTGEVELGGARVVYTTLKLNGVGTHELFFVDCTGDTPGPAIRIHEPLADGWSVRSSARLSASGRWMHYTLEHETMGQEVWLVDMSGPLPGVPKKVEIPPDLPPDVLPGQFSHDETKLALWLAEPGGGHQLYLCSITPDGGCAPERWGVPLAPGGSQMFSLDFSPDDTRIAYVGDPDGDGVRQLFLGGTAPGDAGAAVAVSDDAQPADSGDPAWFSPDGGTLYYAFGPDSQQLGVRAIDLTSDPPTPPNAIIPVGGSYRFRPDGSAVLWWTDPAADGNGGDLTFFSLDGTKVGQGVPIHDVPNHVSETAFLWSTDGRFALYLAGASPTRWELHVVDTSGPTPAAPVKVNAAIGTDGSILTVNAGPDPSYLVFSSFANLGAGDELWLVPLDPPGEPVAVDVPLPATRVLQGDATFNADGSQFLYSAWQEWDGQLELFLADRAAPDASVKVSGPLKPGEQVKSPQFSRDGGLAFYRSQREADGGSRALMVHLDAPGTALPVNDPAHNVATLTVLPPSSQ